jgi:hypothetical protein
VLTAREPFTPLENLILSKMTGLSPADFSWDVQKFLHCKLLFSVAELINFQSAVKTETWRVAQIFVYPQVAAIVKEVERSKRRKMLLKIKDEFRAWRRGSRALHRDWWKLKDLVVDLQQELRARCPEIDRHLEREVKQRFSKIVREAKRTRKRKLVMSDLSRRAQLAFPKGIRGRKLDDKYCKELCKKFNLS